MSFFDTISLWNEVTGEPWMVWDVWDVNVVFLSAEPEQAAVYKRIHLVMVVDVLPPSGHNIWTLHHKILSICCFFLFLVDKEKVCIDEGSALRY